MGIFPKYKVGDFAVASYYNPSLGKDEEHIFQVNGRSLIRDGLSFEWTYCGFYFKVINSDPIKLKYSTFSYIKESEFVPLESRLMRNKAGFDEPERLEPIHPEYKDIDVIAQLK